MFDKIQIEILMGVQRIQNGNYRRHYFDADAIAVQYRDCQAMVPVCFFHSLNFLIHFVEME